MKTAYLLFGCWIAVFAMSAGAWQGIKTKPKPGRAETAPSPTPSPAPAAPKVRPADTAFLSRKVYPIPAGYAGMYMGTLEGVRCFNCAPDQVHLNVGDSLSREAGIIALRIEVWNAIERPLKDRRMYDVGNRCFYFGHKLVDTVFVGGEWTEIRVKEVPCYAYLRRTLQSSLAGTQIPPPVPLEKAKAASIAPAPVAVAADPEASPVDPADASGGKSAKERAPAPAHSEHLAEDVYPAP
jgi:hypothetical protein